MLGIAVAQVRMCAPPYCFVLWPCALALLHISVRDASSSWVHIEGLLAS